MSEKKRIDAVVKKDPEHKHVDRRIRTLKYLLELGDNGEDRNEEMVGRKEAHKFLYEALCFKEEFGDDHIVPELRDAIKKTKNFLPLPKQQNTKRNLRVGLWTD